VQRRQTSRVQGARSLKLTVAECPNCSSGLSRKERFRARFRPIECPRCGTRLRANVKTFLVLFYTVLTVVMFLGLLSSTHVGCLLPFVLFVSVSIAAEFLAALASPIERIDQPRRCQ
jgi:CXXC-20-CXXC protein